MNGRMKRKCTGRHNVGGDEQRAGVWRHDRRWVPTSTEGTTGAEAFSDASVEDHNLGIGDREEKKKW